MTQPPLASFDPASALFRLHRHAAYAANRRHGVVRVNIGDDGQADPRKLYQGYWVLSDALVREVLGRPDEFGKPPAGPTGPEVPITGATSSQRNGLFYLDGADHRAVRGALEPGFAVLTAGLAARAAEEAGKLLPALAAGAPDYVAEFGAELPRRLFFGWFGVPEHPRLPTVPQQQGERTVVDRWARSMLEANDRTVPQAGPQGATASLALRGYAAARLAQLQRRQAQPSAPEHLLDLLARKTCPFHTAWPADGSRLTGTLHHEEAVATAGHFALGGYLSTEFLLVGGLLQLLRNDASTGELAWTWLRRQPADMRPALIRRALDEVLRHDPPFQLADRWVREDGAQLGDFRLSKGNRVVLVYAAANRDPAAWPYKADEFVLERFMDEKAPSVHTQQTYGLAFGGDYHVCIGKDLALDIAAAAFEALLARFPEPRIAKVGAELADPYFRSWTGVHVAFA